MKHKDLIPKIFFVLTFIMILFLGIYAYLDGTTWIYDALMLFIVWIVLLVAHKRVHMQNWMYPFCFASFFIHDAGTFGWYATTPFGIRYDHISHFIVSITLAVIIYNYISIYHSDKKNGLIAVILITLLVVLGLGSIIEMTEFAGAKIFGEGDGMFLWGVGDGAEFGSDNPMEWTNTMLDCIFNTLGALAGIAIMLIKNSLSNKKS